MTRNEVLATLGHPTTAGVARLRQAREAIAELAAGVADPVAARRLTVELNDAHLRLQFALVANDANLVRREGRACAALVDEARRASPDGERAAA